MTDYKSLIEELKYGAEYGCDYDLIERAAAAIEALQATIELMKPYMPDFFPDANKVTLPKMEVQDG